MSTFDQSKWADPAFARDYLDQADHYIPERHYLFHVLRSFHRAFVAGPGAVEICDLGCGDGILTAQLLEEDPKIHATLVDGSTEMLAGARRRFAGQPNVSFVQRTFDELSKDATTLGPFDLVMSSFAIHHLHRPERRGIFGVAFKSLKPGGHFINLEATLAECPGHTEWYYQLWREWIARHGELAGVGNRFEDVPCQARENPDNKYSPLNEQLADLTDAQFNEIECHYKNGVFAIYSGRRPS